MNIGEMKVLKENMKRNLNVVFYEQAISALNELISFKNLKLTPEQLQEIDKLYTEKCKEVSELQKTVKNLSDVNGNLVRANFNLNREIDRLEKQQEQKRKMSERNFLLYSDLLEEKERLEIELKRKKLSVALERMKKTFDSMYSEANFFVSEEKGIKIRKEVLEFIKRRFPNDSKWKDGNCYYFALILADRFNGIIYYDVGIGHFVVRIDNILYDYSGIYEAAKLENLIEWEYFGMYDYAEKERIIRDCII